MWQIVNLPVKVIGLLEANYSPREVAWGVCLGMLLGFTPLNGPMAILFMIFFFLFRLNRTSTTLLFPFFKLLYILGVSGIADRIGSYLLIDANYLNDFWRIVTGLPVAAYLDINNTIVAGGLFISLVLMAPVYFVSKKTFILIKNRYSEKLKDTKIARFVSGLKAVHKTASKVDKVRSRFKV